MKITRVLKVCINPHCEEIAHNCDKDETRCRNCDTRLCEINEDTYRSKFINNSFQYDYRTESRSLVTPTSMGYSIQLSLF